MPEEAGEWVLVGLEAKTANKQGVPVRIPVPTGELEAIGEKGMTVDAIRGWVTRFMSTAPAWSSSAWKTENAALVKSFEAFVGKKEAWAKAQDAFGRRDFKTAIGSLRMIAAIDPGDHASRLNLASALSSEGDHVGALAQLDAITATWADDPEFHMTRANVLLSLDRRDDAVGALVDALERDGSFAPALSMLVKLGVLVSVYENPRDAASLTYVRTDSVVSHLEQVWGAEPRDVTYFLEQAAYHEMERRPAVALVAADRAIALGGDAPNARAVSLKISSLRALGRADEATALARVRVESEKSAAAHVDLARCLLAANKTDEANAEIDKAIAADPGDLTALDLRWWPAERHDLVQLEEAVAHFKAHAEAHPNAAGAWRTLARARLALGDPDAGLPLLEKALSMAPGDDDARAEWWTELLRRGGAETVLADAAKITDMGKRDWKLRWSEAEALGAAKRTMEAQAAFAAINHDESLQIDVRKRAKRAAQSSGGEGTK
jgi:tetratricopeptide (TPR) repeat protein